MTAPLLEVRDLHVEFSAGHGRRTEPIRGIGLRIERGEILGLIGETGCGKTLTGRAILGALPRNATASGKVLFDGQDLLAVEPAERRRLRGGTLALIPQNPGSSLNPVHAIGFQLRLLAQQHLDLKGRAADARIDEELAAVGLDETNRIRKAYPHELSGGMLQRVCIAAALLPRPQVVVADEPTTALDVTIERQILNLIRERQRELGVSMLLITHDMGVVASTCDRVNVLYAGRSIESGVTADVLDQPRHPYTRGLLGALPRNTPRGRRLVAIPGSVPANVSSGAGCAFAPRCERFQPDCEDGTPPTAMEGADHAIECRHFTVTA